MAFFRSSLTGIGVDFGTASVKVVQLVQRKRAVALATYAVASQMNLLTDGRSSDAVARMVLLLREMFRRAGVGRGPVTAALPVLSVFSTVLELPEMPERELDAAVKFAAKNYVPSPLADVILGWTRIGSPTDTSAPSPLPAARVESSVPPSPRNAGKEPASPKLQTRKIQEVFLTAAPRESVDRYTAVFERLEVPLAALEVESFPLARSLLRGEARPALLVDLGNRTTSFSVVDEGYLRINQAMDLGGEALTEAIVRTLSLSLEEAERRKRTEGILATEAASSVGTALRSVLGELVARGETVRRIYERKRGRPVGKVVLIGGGARLPGLPGFWSSATGLPTEVGNPWRGIVIPPSLAERLTVLGPAFAVAVGLALRAFGASR